MPRKKLGGSRIRLYQLFFPVAVACVSVVIAVVWGNIVLFPLVLAVAASFALGWALEFAPQKIKTVYLLVVGIGGGVLVAGLWLVSFWVFLAWVSAFGTGYGVGQLVSRQSGKSAAPVLNTEIETPGTMDSAAAYFDNKSGWNVFSVTSDEVLSKVRSLDGEQVSAVSVMESGNRLDIAGDAQNRMMVYFSSEPDKAVPTWSLLLDGNGGDEEVQINVAGVVGTFKQSSTVTLKLAVQATEHFLKSQQKDPSLNWETSHQVNDMRSPQLQSWRQDSTH